MASRRRIIRDCRRAMGSAPDYATWLAAAEELDLRSGLLDWREDDSSPHYHPAVLKEDLHKLAELRDPRRADELVGVLQELLYRSLNDVLEPALYTTAHAGTKRLVSRWLHAAEAAIEGLVEARLPGWDRGRKLEVIRGAYRNLGRSALTLSGGASLGFYHLGVIKALWAERLLPEVIAGASMGAMIAAGICCRTDAELDALFADPELGAIDTLGLEWRGVREALSERSLMRPERMLEVVRHNCGSYTFGEAFARSGRVLNISLMPTRTRQKPRVLNHLTAKDVWVPRATLASSAIPGIYPPCALTKKGDGSQGELPYIEGETWIDGSFGGDLPSLRLSRLHNVNHFIVSQTQPHALPLMAGVNKKGLVGLASMAAVSTARAQGVQILGLSHRLAAWTPLGSPLELAQRMLQQEYSGDISIHPRFDPRAYPKLFRNLSREELLWFVAEGERAAWPRLAMIRDSTRISRCLARCERRLLGGDGL